MHAGDRARRVLLLTWAAAGGVPGALVGVFAGGSRGAGGAGPALTGGAIGALAIGLGVGFLSNSAGAAAGAVLSPSGRSSPDRSDDSLAQSLVARGRYAEAAAEYRRLCEARPGDADPCLRLARLCRDRLALPEEAVTWLTRAIERATAPGVEQLAARELVELLDRRMGTPARALPVLARQAERHRGTPHGAWAAATLATLRRGAFDGPAAST